MNRSKTQSKPSLSLADWLDDDYCRDTEEESSSTTNSTCPFLDVT